MNPKFVAVLLVVAAFGASFAGYWTVQSTHRAAVPPTPLYGYTQTGHYDYVARLAPNSLYNTTTLTPGNGTLFTSITEWVNLSFAFGLLTTQAVNASFAGTVTVEIVTPYWTKPITALAMRGTVTDGTAVAVGDSYDLNVSFIASVVSTIGAQLGSTPSSYQVVLNGAFASTVSRGAELSGFSFGPQLRLNFSGGRITPSALSTSSGGSVIANPGSAAATRAPSPLPVGLFVLCAATVGVTGTLLYRDAAERRVRNLGALMRPYQEAIVDIRGPPVAASTIPVRAWEDIVKVADTIGMPILRTTRVRMDGGEPTVVFYVVSGGTAYLYVHAADGQDGDVPPGSVVGPERAASPAVRDWMRRFPEFPGAHPDSLESFVAASEKIRARVDRLPPLSPVRADAEALLLKAVGLAQRRELDAAWVVLGQAGGRLGRGARAASP